VPLVREAVAAVQATAADHDVRVIAPARLPATVDPLRIEQVVVNLLGNAVKYSPAGGRIEVELAAPREGVARVAVRDHGNGVPPAVRGRLFERFVRGHDDEHRSGMGLGLYVSRQIVELHGGTIRHESPPDGGSRFVVELPRDVPRDASALGAG
jgi:signal transduction histidine kinase